MHTKGKSPAIGQDLNDCYYPGNSLKDNNFLNQKKRVFLALFQSPKSMLEVAVETNVLRANICWYLEEWVKKGSAKRVRTGICSITKMKVGLYSTNPRDWEKGKEAESGE